MTIDRRALLKLLASAPLLARGVPTAAAPAASDSARFSATSAALTGYPAADTSDTASMMRAFATPERRAALARLESVVAATPAAGLDAALREQGLETLA